jgi:hypothetical protein
LLRFFRSIIEKKIHRRIFSVSLDHSDRSSGACGGGQQVSLVFKKLQLLQPDPEFKLSGQPFLRLFGSHNLYFVNLIIAPFQEENQLYQSNKYK